MVSVLAPPPKPTQSAPMDPAPSSLPPTPEPTPEAGDVSRRTAALDFSRRLSAITAAVRRRERRFVLGLLGGALLATLLLGWLLFGLTANVWPARLLLVTAIVGSLVAGWKRKPARLFLSPRMLSFFAVNAPGLSSGLSSAEALAKQPNGSDSLAALHLRWAHQALDHAFVAKETERFFRPKRRRLLQAFAALGLLLAVALVGFGPHTFSRYMRQLVLNDDSEWATVPIVGDLSLTLKPPAYTGQPPREVRGGDGTIRALLGTVVTLRATAAESVSSAELRVIDESNPDAKERVVPLVVSNGKHLLGELIVEKTERYRFVLRSAFSTAQKERKGHSIVALEDRAPKITLEAPLADVELKDTGRVLFRYECEDDFGLRELAFVYKVGHGEEKRVPLNLAENRNKHRGDYAFDIAPLSLRAGDAVSAYVEVYDNDTVRGKKRGVSPTRTITIFSAEQHKRELLDKLQKLMDRFVDLLADELENPVVDSLASYQKSALAIDDKAQALIGDLSQIATALQQTDEKTRQTFALGVDRSAKELRAAYEHKRGVDAAAAVRPNLIAAQQAAVVLLERTIIYFEDLRGMASIEEIKALASDLARTSQDLRQLLAKYKETKDPTLKAALEAEMAQLRERLGEIQKKMADLKRGMNEGFMNQEAFERGQVQNTLESMEQLLAEDRLDELANELERLSNQLDNMAQRVDKADKEYGEDRYKGLREEIQAFQQSFEAMEQAEKQALEESEQLEQAYRQQVQKQIGESLDKLVSDTRKDLADAEKNLAADSVESRLVREQELAERALQRTSDAARSLEARDFLETREMVRDAFRSTSDLVRQLRAEESLQAAYSMKGKTVADRRQHAEKSAEALQRAMQRLDKLFPDPREVMTPKQQQQMEQLANKQQQIAKQAQQLQDQMKQINQQAPIFGEDAQEDMRGASGDMSRAEGELKQGQAAKAGSAQRSALSKLKKMREQMKQQQQQGGSGGQGMPRPFGGLPNPLGEGGGEDRNEKVEIPSSDAFAVPPEFRRDILDAMKQGTPDAFKQQVEDFYRELIK